MHAGKLWNVHIIQECPPLLPSVSLIADIGLLEVAVEQLSPSTYDLIGVVDALQKEQSEFLGPGVVSRKQVGLKPWAGFSSATDIDVHGCKKRGY